jgi:Protein of unknown function (DUF4031)
MTIYVDALLTWNGGYRGRDAAQAARTGNRHGHQWCHLFSDADDDHAELHAFARRLGLKRDWFQGDHYDLVPPRRAAAVSLGAVAADRATSVAIWNAARARRGPRQSELKLP